MDDWLAAHPDVSAIQVVAVDLNGLARGKRLPSELARKATSGGMRMPLSALNVDLWGDDIEDSPLVFESGDKDGLLRPTERGFVPVPWLDTPTALLPMWMSTETGAPYSGDPRHALATVLDRLKADHGLSPVVATELEFYLIDTDRAQAAPPPSPLTGEVSEGGEILSMRELEAFDAFFTDLYDGCAAMGIPAEAATSESGPGQFEINLTHGPALKAADDAWLFKTLAKGLARKHGFAATFMAKPHVEHAGNGLHAHVSLVDDEGRNAFDDGSDTGNAVLLHAISGCLQVMPQATAIFAPHGSSYDRFVPGAHAPTGIAWGYENRTAAIRVPGGPPGARRLEHRVAGGDINPYLFLTAVIGGILVGLEDQTKPPAPITGNAYDLDLPQIPADWDSALEALAGGPDIKRIFPARLIDNFCQTKRQEQTKLATLNADAQMALYLDTV